ncbi:MAG: hypothetical protein ACUVT8_06325 [Armatimonadota bacterium]
MTEKTMKCPRCDTNNGKTNRFCRGCGLKLEGLTTQPPSERPAQEGVVKDELAVGEELFEIWQIYSRGDLDEALARVQRVLEQSPESSSAHSLLALIYERKADTLFQGGKPEEARGLLKLAVAEYEKIIDLNPDSAADREKLASLRLRLALPEGPPTSQVQPSWRARLSAIIDLLPKPAWVAFVTFVVVFVVALIAMPGGNERGESEHKLRQTKQKQASSARVRVQPQPPALKVYTFPAPVSASLAGPVKGVPQTQPERPAPSGTTAEPSRIPPLSVPGVKIVPESKKTESESKPAEKTQEPTPVKTPSVEEKPSKLPTGDTALRQAVEFRRQGKHQEALEAAQEAVRLYQADIDAGRNLEAAKNGLQTAQKLIEVSRQALAGSGQTQ